LASLEASSNSLVILWANRLSVEPVLRFVRLPSGSVKHAIQNGLFGNRLNEAMSHNNSYNIHPCQWCS